MWKQTVLTRARLAPGQSRPLDPGYASVQPRLQLIRLRAIRTESFSHIPKSMLGSYRFVLRLPQENGNVLKDFGEHVTKRLILTLVVMAAILGGLGYVKFRQVEVAIAQGASFQMPATAVTTVVAQRETWPSTLTVIGTAAAIQGVTVSADLPGTIDKIHFESGQWVHEGDILVELDTRQERAQLANLEAQRDLAGINYGRAQELVKAGVISRSDYDNANAQQKATEAQVGDIKAAIARKTIRAPFTGLLGIRQVSLGQYLAAGQAIVALQSVDPIYVNFGVPQQQTAPDEVRTRSACDQWRSTRDGIHRHDHRARFCHQ